MIVGTAGHIDHGKSALVTALTGRPVDRLVEERRRGITIELNFAPLELDGLPPVGIVDVPGHEDFVRNMVAGASGIDLLLLVVDLVEGPRPQTEEHLAIAEQLRIARGIPVFTKVDLVDPEWSELVVTEMAARLARSPVAFAEPAVVSAVTGQGIDALRVRIANELGRVARRATDDVFRLPVDRVFSVAGVGTVVTGTTWSGRIGVGDSIKLLPGGQTGRVRSIECYGTEAQHTDPGTRTAIGLAGIERDQVQRGDVAVGANVPWRATDGFDAEIELLPSALKPLTARSRVRVHVGTAELMARVYPRGAIAPGSSGLARVALEAPTVVRGGDRFVLRAYSPVTTIGGGWVVDAVAPGRAAWPVALTDPDPARRLAALVERRRRGLALESVPSILGISPANVDRVAEEAGTVVIGGMLYSTAAVEGLERRILDAIAAQHAAAPDQDGLSLETARRAIPGAAKQADDVLARLEAAGRIRVRDDLVALPGFAPVLEGGADVIDALVRRIAASGLEPPTIEEIATALGITSIGPIVKRAVADGRLVLVERDRYFASDELQRFLDVLTELGRAGRITPKDVRDRLGLSRKFMIPLLEWADRRGVTRREGDARVLVGSDR